MGIRCQNFIWKSPLYPNLGVLDKKAVKIAAFKGHFIIFCLLNGSTIDVQSHFNMSWDIKKLWGGSNSLGHTVPDMKAFLDSLVNVG